MTAQRTLMALPLPGAKPWKHQHVLVHARALSTTATSQPWPAELPTPGPSTFPPGDDQDKRYVVAVAHELAARNALARTKELPFSHDGKSWQVLAVEPTLEAWTYLERVRYCSANPRACR